MADLVFNILEQRLSGIVDGVHISARAVSGGRAGTKTAGAVNPILANNPYLTNVGLTKEHPGGTLPLGLYRLHTHEHKPNILRLIPITAKMHGRGGFEIHGRGKRGSDGCIVPTDFHNVQLLWKLTEAREDDGQEGPSLEVVAIGDADEPLRRIDLWRHTA